MGAKSAKEIRILDTSVFDNLPHTVLYKVVRERVKDFRIYKYHFRLIKCSDKIFTLWQIYSNLAAHRRVDLSQQGSRNLDQLDAAQVT